MNERILIKEYLELIDKLKQSKHYIEESISDDPIPVEKGYVASLYKGNTLLGSFMVKEGINQCLRPYYWDTYLETVVGTKESFHVNLKYETLSITERIQKFNEKALEAHNKAKEKGFDIGDLYQIKNLEKFKTT